MCYNYCGKEALAFRRHLVSALVTDCSNSSFIVKIWEGIRIYLSGKGFISVWKGAVNYLSLEFYFR